MDFIDQLKLISQRVNALKDQLQTEEATKMSLVIPLYRYSQQRCRCTETQYWLR